MRSIDIGYLTQKDILYGEDDAMLELLQLSDDDQVRAYIHAALHAKELCREVSGSDANLSYIGKFRGVNPWVRVSGQYYRLADIDKAFKEKFDAVRSMVVCEKQYYIHGIT